MMDGINNGNLMVSIWCPTYNQVNYIRNTLEGILMQDTNFKFDILIYDDASTDGTSDIVREYAERYPDIVHAVISPKNTFRAPERRKQFSYLKRRYLKGKYIAQCDGDDLWIDRNKLQIQIDYMESHPECSMYIHDALWLNCMDGTMKAGMPFDGSTEQDVTAENIIMQYNGFPPASSFVYRGEQVNRPWLFDAASVGDYTALLYALSTGCIHYSSRIMSVYRWLDSGSWNTTRRKDQSLAFYSDIALMDFLIKYDKHTDYKYHEWCEKKYKAYAFSAVYSVDLNISISDCIKDCKQKGFSFPEECLDYVDGLESLRNSKLPVELERFVNKYEHVIIMGAGEYAACVANQLTHNQVKFEGFAVTVKKDGEDFYLGKPVWNLSELPYNKANTGVVVGINPAVRGWGSILNSLELAQIVNYYCPFL